MTTENDKKMFSEETQNIRNAINILWERAQYLGLDRDEFAKHVERVVAETLEK